MKKGFAQVIIILLLVLLLGVSVAFAYYYGSQKGKSENNTVAQVTQAPQESPTTAITTSTSTVMPTSTIPAGWQTYTNEEYGFEISFPANYEALDDEENLYGWPNGIVLIYSGGQSYDLAIEHWNSATQYQAKYNNQTNLTVENVGSVIITLLNTNFDSEVDQIIQTFRTI